LRHVAARDAPQNRVDEPARAPRRELHRLAHRRILRDVHVQELIRPDTQHIENLGLDRSPGQRLHDEIEPRPPAQHAEDERAHEAGLAEEQERGEGGLALDAAEELERASTFVHSLWPGFHPPPRARSAAATRGLPARCTAIRRIAPSPAATTTPSSS